MFVYNQVMIFPGPGLTFVAFPIALSQMPLPQLWSVLFFCTLVLVIFDSMVSQTKHSCISD